MSTYVRLLRGGEGGCRSYLAHLYTHHTRMILNRFSGFYNGASMRPVFCACMSALDFCFTRSIAGCRLQNISSALSENHSALIKIPNPEPFQMAVPQMRNSSLVPSGFLPWGLDPKAMKYRLKSKYLGLGFKG